MAKFLAVDNATKEVFVNAFEKAGLTQSIKFDVVNDPKQKTLYKVTKAAPYVTYKSGIELVVFLNEDIFWQLEDEQQQIVAEEAIAGVSYNDEKDAINIEKPDVTTFSGILRKYGAEKHEVLRESIKTLYQVKENKGEESSEAQPA